MDGFRAVLFLFLSLALGSSARASSPPIHLNAEWYASARLLSMGNAGIAVPEDPTSAMFYNPAGLARNKKTSLEFFNPQIEFGTGDVSNTAAKTQLGKNFKLAGVAGSLVNNPYKPSSLGASIYPNIWGQNFAFGILARVDQAAYADSRGTIYYGARYLVIPTMGISVGLLDGRFKMGFAVRGIQITETNGSLTNYFDAGYLKNPSEGLGLGVDAGVLITMPWSYLPTIGAVARNIGDTSFGGDAYFSVARGTVTRHQMIKSTYDAGASISPKLSQRTTMLLSADYRDVLDQMGTPTLRHVNLGMEIDFSKTVYFRLGVREGYWSAGVGIAGRKASMDLGSYAEELDGTAFRSVEDRRLVLRFGSRF